MGTTLPIRRFPLFIGVLLLAVLTACSSEVALDVVLKQREVALLVGEEYQAVASIHSSTLVNTRVNWESSDERIATVSETGLVRGISAGTATITARSAAHPAKAAQLTVQVVDGSFRSFTLRAEDNSPQLLGDIPAYINHTKRVIYLVLSGHIDPTALVATFETLGGDVFVGNQRQVSGESVNDFSSQLTYLHDTEAGVIPYTVSVLRLDNTVPHIQIVTDGLAPVVSKDERVAGYVVIDGGDHYPSAVEPMEIKGRGNSTWKMPKKPYQLKLDNSVSLLNLAAGKKWILLQNYIDGTLMGNAIAMQMGHLLEMPFTHTMIPVDVTLNGQYMGSYMFTEQKEVAPNRIDVGQTGVYIELDDHDKPSLTQFTTTKFNLPVIVKYPEEKHFAPGEVDAAFAAIRDDFEHLIARIYLGEDISDIFDFESLAKYLIVFYMSANAELNSPKSVYMYRVDNGPYHMGPLWDFDWAWGYTSAQRTHFVNHTRPTLLNPAGGRPGAVFFSYLITYPEFVAAIQDEWEVFKEHLYPELITYMEQYSETIRTTFERDVARWGRQYSSFVSMDKEHERMFQWMDDRLDYVDSVINGL